MSDVWATNMIQALRNKDKQKSEYGVGSGTNEIMIGTVVSSNPLTIEINGQTIQKFLYINPAYTLLADDGIDKIEEAFEDSLKLEGGMDGTAREPKSGTTGTVDRYINVVYTKNPIENVAWYDFLREFHQNFIIKKGDMVIVIHTGVSFFIVSKAVNEG